MLKQKDIYQPHTNTDPQKESDQNHNQHHSHSHSQNPSESNTRHQQKNCNPMLSLNHFAHAHPQIPDLSYAGTAHRFIPSISPMRPANISTFSPPSNVVHQSFSSVSPSNHSPLYHQSSMPSITTSAPRPPHVMSTSRSPQEFKHEAAVCNNGDLHVYNEALENIADLVLSEMVNDEQGQMEIGNASPTSESKKSSSNNKKSNKKKRKKAKKKQSHNAPQGIGYEPHAGHRAQGNIQIAKSMTEQIVPDGIKEHLRAVYGYLDKAVSLSIASKAGKPISDRLQIFNFSLHDRVSGEEVYCIAEAQDVCATKSRGYRWKMRNKLFTRHDVMNEYGIGANQLPMSWRTTERFCNELIAGHQIESYLQDASNAQGVIDECQWHKIPVYKRVNNKRRLTLSLTKPEFMRQLALYWCGANETEQGNHVQQTRLIPILMFNAESGQYWMEHVWVAVIDEGVSVGISFQYVAQTNTVKVSGIHLDREYLQAQHALVSPDHECHCFDTFHSYISDLRIGNPDDLQNKINYYKQVISDLSEMRSDLIDVSPSDLAAFQELQQRVAIQANHPKALAVFTPSSPPTPPSLRQHGSNSFEHELSTSYHHVMANPPQPQQQGGQLQPIATMPSSLSPNNSLNSPIAMTPNYATSRFAMNSPPHAAMSRHQVQHMMNQSNANNVRLQSPTYSNNHHSLNHNANQLVMIEQNHFNYYENKEVQER